MNKRLTRLTRLFSKNGIDALFVSSEENVTYLSNFRGSESFLFITRNNRFFLTDFRYLEQAKKETNGFKIILRDSQSYPQILKTISRKEKSKNIGFESSRISHVFYTQLCQALGDQSLIPTSNLIESLRVVKERIEIENLKQAVHITAEGIRNLQATVSPGMNEKGIQAKLEYHTKMWGSEKPAFDIIIAAGPKSSMPHAVSDHRSRIRDNDILLVDMGVVFNGYHSDLTRCVFLGKIPPLMRKVYDIVLKAQELSINKVGPGVPTKAVDAAGRSYIQKKGYGKYFGHGTGHGVGLEIHEAPTVSGRSTEVLKPGMVITVEPGIYLPGRFGVRI